MIRGIMDEILGFRVSSGDLVGVVDVVDLDAPLDRPDRVPLVV